MENDMTRPRAPTGSLAEELHARSQVSQFVVAFVKALLHSSQYTTDHPEVRKLNTSLYEQFQALSKGRTELTFLAKIGGDSKEIQLDGVFEEPVNLALFMPPAVGDLFLPKLREYFDRRRLLSCSIKANIPLGEFDALLAILSAFAAPAGERAGNVPAETAQALVARGVTHVSVVFLEELIGRERQLPWRVEMALTRLRKDLRMIPLYKRSEESQVRRAKTQVIDDIIRPLRRPDLLKGIILNCDLIAKDLLPAGEAAIELKIIERVPPGMLGSMALEFGKELEGTPSAETLVRQRARQFIKAIVARLHDQSIADADKVLTQLFDQQILELTDLPMHLQEAIAARRFADTFLAHEPQHLDRLRSLRADPKSAASYAHLVPELLQREKYASAQNVLTALEELAGADASASPAFTALLEGVRASVARGAVFHLLLERLRAGSGGVREKVTEFLAGLGRPGVPPLIEELLRTDDRDVRRHLISVLAHMGQAALWSIRVVLDRPNMPQQGILDLLAVLGQIGGPEASYVIQRFLHHAEAPVREEAVAAFARVAGREGETDLLGMLRDQVPAVRHRAVLALGEMACAQPKVIAGLCELVRRRDKGEREEEDQLQIRACHALVEVARATLSARPQIERTLVAALDLDSGRGFLGRFGGGPRKSDGVRSAICAALGQIGGSNATRALALLARDRNPVLRERAARALRVLGGATVKATA